MKASGDPGQEKYGPAERPTLTGVPQTFSRLSRPASLVVLIASLILGLIIIYNILLFLQTESNFTAFRRQWDGSLWETIYDDFPKARSYFGYPKREGWKTIGALQAQGQFPGDFRSMNEDFVIPIWYNYGQARSCYNTPAHYFVRINGDENPLSSEQYTEVGQVQREGEVRLHIFSKRDIASQSSPIIYSLENFETIFDQLATPRQFTQQSQPAHWKRTLFGTAIQFLGYDLSATSLAPGDTLYVTLYWRALKKPEDNYRAFVHLTDGTTLWSQQDDTPVCRLPTSIWRAGQQGSGQFRLPINPETPAGRYPLIIGLYQADRIERLKITAGAGQIGDDFLWLSDVEIKEK